MIRQENLTKAQDLIEDITFQLDLPGNIKFQAIQIYKQVLEKDLTRGRQIREMVVATMKIVLNDKNIPIIFQDFKPWVPMGKRKRIYRYEGLIRRELNIKLKSSFPYGLVFVFSDRLELSNQVRNKALRTLESITKNKRTWGKSPAGIIAGVLYICGLSMGEHRTQDMIASVAGVTSSTIRQRVRDLEVI